MACYRRDALLYHNRHHKALYKTSEEKVNL